MLKKHLFAFKTVLEMILIHADMSRLFVAADEKCKYLHNNPNVIITTYLRVFECFHKRIKTCSVKSTSEFHLSSELTSHHSA